MSIKRAVLTLFRRLLGTQHLREEFKEISDKLEELSARMDERTAATVDALHRQTGYLMARLAGPGGQAARQFPATAPGNGEASTPAAPGPAAHRSPGSPSGTPPTLSVLMTNYNHGQYLETSLGAILAQTFRPAEVIVVDDGSTDQSLAVLEGMARKDPIVRVIRNKKNLGVVAAWHEGYRHVRGDYLYSASADDCVLPGLFEKSMALLAEYPQAALCCSYPASFQEDAAGGTLAWKPNPVYWSETPCYLCPEELADVLCGDYVPGHTTIMKRSALDQAGGLRPELKWHCDWFATLVMAFRHGLCFLPEPLAGLRITPASYSAAGVNLGVEQEEVLLELLRLLKSPGYRDVLPYFAASGALGLLNERHRLVRAYFARPEQWDAAGLALIQQPLWEWCRGQSDIRAERTRKRIEANRASARAAAPAPTPSGH